MTIKFIALPTKTAAAYRAGALDANGQAAEQTISDGGGNPCRHCLQDIPAGAPMLVCCHRPFDGRHPYAESGPIFLCASDCERAQDGGELPAILATREAVLIRGYDLANRIVEGTGQMVPTAALVATADRLLANPAVRYCHVRSASNSCFQCQIEVAESTAGPVQ